MRWIKLNEKMEQGNVESKYVQQHLANERTFLAWIRTTITIIGIGLVTTSLHFELKVSENYKADLLIRIIGFSTLLLGLLTLLFAVSSYIRKRKGINTNTFHSASTFITFMGSFLVGILLLFGIYLFFAY